MVNVKYDSILDGLRENDSNIYPIFSYNSGTGNITMELESGDSYSWAVSAVENFTLISGENMTLIGGENFITIQ